MPENRVHIRTLHPLVQILLIGTVVVSTVQSMCGPYFAVFLMRHTHLSVVAIGAMMGARALSATVGGFVGGTLSDLIGRTEVMIGALVVETFVYVGYSLVRTPVVVLLLMVLSGFLGAFFGPTAKAVIADVTAPNRRVSVFTWQYVGANIGYAVGPLLGVLLGVVGGSAPFLAMSTVYLCYAITLTLCIRRYPAQSVDGSSNNGKSLLASLRAVSTDKVLSLFIFGGFLTTLVHGQWSTPISEFLMQRFSDGQNMLAALLTTNAVAVIIVQPLLSRYVRRSSPLKHVAAGGVFMAVGSVVFAFSGGWLSFVTGMVIFTLGEVLIVPSEYAMIDGITPNAVRGAYYGATSFTGLGNFAGPWLFSVILSHWNGDAMFAGMAGFALFSVLIYWIGSNWNRGHAPVLI